MHPACLQRNNVRSVPPNELHNCLVLVRQPKAGRRQRRHIGAAKVEGGQARHAWQGCRVGGSGEAGAAAAGAEGREGLRADRPPVSSAGVCGSRLLAAQLPDQCGGKRERIEPRAQAARDVRSAHKSPSRRYDTACLTDDPLSAAERRSAWGLPHVGCPDTHRRFFMSYEVLSTHTAVPSSQPQLHHRPYWTGRLQWLNSCPLVHNALSSAAAITAPAAAAAVATAATAPPRLPSLPAASLIPLLRWPCRCLQLPPTPGTKHGKLTRQQST